MLSPPYGSHSVESLGTVVSASWQGKWRARQARPGITHRRPLLPTRAPRGKVCSNRLDGPQFPPCMFFFSKSRLSRRKARPRIFNKYDSSGEQLSVGNSVESGEVRHMLIRPCSQVMLMLPTMTEELQSAAVLLL